MFENLPTFPTQSGAFGMPATPYVNSLFNPGTSFLSNWQNPGVSAPDLSAPIALPTLPGLDSINVAQQPGMLQSMGNSFTDWFNKTPLATSLDTKTGMKTQGMFDMGLGAAQGLLGAYLGFQNLGIAKDTLAQNKRAFDLNFNAQRNLTNSRLSDRQAGRVAFDPSQTSVAAYMKQNGI